MRVEIEAFKSNIIRRFSDAMRIQNTKCGAVVRLDMLARQTFNRRPILLLTKTCQSSPNANQTRVGKPKLVSTILKQPRRRRTPYGNIEGNPRCDVWLETHKDNSISSIFYRPVAKVLKILLAREKYAQPVSLTREKHNISWILLIIFSDVTLFQKTFAKKSLR
jgi:hypothetical protein